MRRLPSNAAHRRPAENGAATLIAVLFLLIVVAFAVLVATSMSASDIADTNVQQSGVNALFLAESGLERASGLFVSGVDSCANLATDGLHTLGAGSFTINATYTTDFGGATLPANECRVQSVGTVGNVQRTVQGILQLPASSGMVVGNGGVAYQCGGSTCAATPTGTTQDLKDVSCASAASCLAVGSAGTAIQWNGASWNPAAGVPVNDALTSVICDPANGGNCYAGGSNGGGAGVFLQWNRASSTWTTLTTPPAPIQDLTCLFNSGGVTCFAIGTTGPTSSLIAKYIGSSSSSSWTTVDPLTAQALNGISCLSLASCWAVGNKMGNGSASQMNIVGFTGGAWVPPTRVFSPNHIDTLEDVACIDANDCWAVGFKNANFAYWNGTEWFHPSNAKIQLMGIACLPTAGTCWTVGAGGTVILGTVSGASWTSTAVALSPATTQQFNAVSFPAGSGGSGGSSVLIEWHEVVS